MAAGLYSFINRARAESRNRAVELVVDWPDAMALANTHSREINAALTDLRKAGITTVALLEETLESLHNNGVLTYRTEKTGRDDKETIIDFTPGFEDQETRVIAALGHKTKLRITAAGSREIRVNAPWPQFNGTPIGLDNQIVATIKNNGLLVAPRLLNFTGVNENNIRWELGEVKKQCGPNAMGPLIFSGSAVLGYRGRMDAAAHAIEDLGLTYGSVEFAKTFGDEDLSRAAAANTVRVHSIGLDEMGSMEEPTAVERFTRAARERNIRVCYVRLFVNGLSHESDTITANHLFVTDIVDGLHNARLVVQGPAHSFRSDPKPGKALRLAMGAGVAAAFIILLSVFTGLDGAGFWGAFLVCLLGCLALAWPESTSKGRELLALAASCAFPTLAFCAYPIRAQLEKTAKSPAAYALWEYIRITLITSVGIVYVVGLLSGRLFMLKIDSFLGVKLVLIAPVLLVSLFYGFGLSDVPLQTGWEERRRIIMRRIAGLVNHPLKAGEVCAGMVALALFALFVARSGNDPGVGVSSAELKMRALLDKYLLVRPRTKEFLMGHPALIIGLLIAAAGRRRKSETPEPDSGLAPTQPLKTGRSRIWLVGCLILGAVGQSSLVDTFCHLHTPLLLSFLRCVIGLVLGAIIGLIVFAIFGSLRAHRESSS
jgi:hypothetical protein